MNYVILAANSHPDYQFLLPLTAILWKERTHYMPFVYTPPKPQEALVELSNKGILKLNIVSVCNDRMDIKLQRWYSHKDYKHDDVALLMDVDLWPVEGAFWNRPVSKPVTCFYGDAFQGKRHATAGFRAVGSALAEIAPGFRWNRLDALWALPEGDERRHSDDAAQSELVLKWMKDHPADYELVERGPSPPWNRIDRYAWPETFDLASGKADAHLPRDASDRRVWNMIRPLFELLAPGWAGWAKVYRNQWERAYHD